MKIGIAGAGLLGRLLAFQLDRAGHDVHVFDPAPHAEARGAAGWTAAGMLSPVAELECADENVFRLGLRTITLWPQLLAQLDVPVEFVRAARGGAPADLGSLASLAQTLAAAAESQEFERAYVAFDRANRLAGKADGAAPKRRVT